MKSNQGKYKKEEYNAETALMQLRCALEDVTILAAEGSFNAGSFIFPAEGNPPDLGARAQREGKIIQRPSALRGRSPSE